MEKNLRGENLCGKMTKMRSGQACNNHQPSAVNLCQELPGKEERGNCGTIEMINFAGSDQ